jgi:hypothetical protein
MLALAALAVPLAVLLPPDPLTTVPIRTLLGVSLGLPVATSYARGRRSLRRLGTFVVVIQMLWVTLVPGLVVGYAALAALRSVPGGAALIVLVNRLLALIRPVGTTALVVSRYGLAYYVVYRNGYEALFRWLPG